jgi:pentatricopeptide repeat protein
MALLDVNSAFGNIAYSLRVELTFFSFFVLLWLLGRAVAPQFVGKPYKKTDFPRKDSPLPANKRAFHQQGNRANRNKDGLSEFDSLEDTLHALSNIDLDKLLDPDWLLGQVTFLCRSQVQRALDLHRAAMNAGLKLRKVSLDDCHNLYTVLVTSGLRVGAINDVTTLLKELNDEGPGVTPSLFTSVVKLCTSKQYFAECLAIHDQLVKPTLFESLDKTVWSCLLFCAVEAKAWRKCDRFFSSLSSCGTPSAKDFGNMVRFASATNDWRKGLDVIKEMLKLGLDIDNVVYNTVLATCVSSEQLEGARVLLEDMTKHGAVADVITYNTLAKGFAKAGQLDKCFKLYEQMRIQGVTPSQVTYGILLDASINDNKVEEAAKIFESMQKEGCPMNIILYTTLIKGFARAGQVDHAMAVYERMKSERSLSPDLITFSILIKANCDHGHLEAALKLFGSMQELGLKPDEVIFNNLLGGCVKDSNAVLAKTVYTEMIAVKVKPSNATFSILIRLYMQCKLFDEAVEVLRTEPSLHGVQVESRLFSQLAQSCLRERQGRRAVEVYKMLAEHSTPTNAVHASLLGMCAKLNMLDTGAEILSLAADNGANIDVKDVHGLLEAAVKKKKTQVVEVIQTIMSKLNLHV